MKRKFFKLGLPVLFLLVFVGIYLLLSRQVEIHVDGEVLEVQTRAFTVNGILHDAGIALQDHDRVTPDKNSLVGFNRTITLVRAKPVTIITPDDHFFIQSAERIPSAWLAEAGITLQPEDILLWNTEPIEPDDMLDDAAQYCIQLVPYSIVTIKKNGESISFETAATSVLQALWDAGVQLTTADRVSVPLYGSPSQFQQVDIQPAHDIVVIVEGDRFESKSAASRVGDALSDLNLSLQGLDYTIPASDQSVPADGSIQIIRVEEVVQVNETITPFGTGTTPDPELAMGEQRIIQIGQPGITASVKRLRLENDREISSSIEGERIFSTPIDQIVGVGTQPVIQTIDTPYGVLEYYQAVDVYATSYSPCNIGTGACSYTTASGLPVQQGVIGVIRSWYNAMRGQRVYIPGYGIAVIGDIGGGVPGSHWIDLAYSEEDYVAWHQNVTLYFLTPIPETILWPLP